MISPLALLCLASAALAHIPFADNGHYTSFDSAFVFPDESVARTLNIDFACDSPALFSEVNVQNSTSFHVGLGLPDIPALYSVKPNYWIIGKNVVPSEKYTDSTSDSQVTIPEGYTGYKVTTADSGMFFKFGEGPSIKGIVLLGVTVAVTAPGPVYVVVENPGVISSRVWLAVGTKEVGEVQVDGEATQEQVLSWYAADTFTATTCGSNESAAPSASADSSVVESSAAESSATGSSAVGSSTAESSTTESSAPVITSGGEGATVTVTNEQTTVVTITSCSHDVCHETTVPATLGPVTTTIEGVETIYTTWCPVSDEVATATVTNEHTTIVTITSCSNDVCHETTAPATLGPVTTTIEGVETIYTTWCPVSGETAVTESAVESAETVVTESAVESAAGTTVIVESSAGEATTLVSVTTGGSSNSSSTISTYEAGAAKVGAGLAMMAVPIALLF